MVDLTLDRNVIQLKRGWYTLKDEKTAVDEIDQIILKLWDVEMVLKAVAEHLSESFEQQVATAIIRNALVVYEQAVEGLENVIVDVDGKTSAGTAPKAAVE